jgi:hypothetical protein
MRIAHIIIIHKNLNQLARLIKSMQHPQFDFYVHVDGKVSDQELKKFVGSPNIIFINNRIKCNWGGFTILRAIFNSISEIVSSGKRYDFINLISGQDYPISSPRQILDFLGQHTGKNFISYDTSSESEWWKKAAHRYQKYHLTDFNIKGRYMIERMINSILPARKFPEYSTLYGGNKSTWWTISGECGAYLDHKFRNSPELVRFSRFCWGTDEFVIPTLILNSRFKDQVINESLRYIDWSEGNASPKIFDVSDFEKIMSSKMLFARKFDLDKDSEILDKIDLAISEGNN